MSQPRLVAHVITRLDVGGAQATAVRTCALLDRERYRPLLVTGDGAGSGGSYLPAAEEAGIEVVVLPELVAPIRPLSDVRAVRSLRRLMADRGVDLVHTHSSKAGALGRFAMQRSGVPTIHTVHGWSFHSDQNPLVSLGYRAIERLLARVTSKLIVVTRVDREIGVRYRIGRPDQYVLIRSGIALPEARTEQDRASAREVLGWNEEVLGLVSVGRLEEQKDPLTLVDAFARVVSSVPNARLAMVGDGALRSAVEDRILALGINESVSLLGVRHDVIELLPAADLYVSSARWEGLPRTLIEASAIGLPGVVTDVGGVSEVVEPGVSGVLVQPSEVDDLAEGIILMLSDASLLRNTGAAVLERVYEFGEDEMVQRTMDVYDSVFGVVRDEREGSR